MLTLPIVDEEAMKALEGACLARLLEAFARRCGAPAERLGISRKQLWETVRMHGLAELAAAGADNEA